MMVPLMTKMYIRSSTLVWCSARTTMQFQLQFQSQSQYQHHRYHVTNTNSNTKAKITTTATVSSFSKNKNPNSSLEFPTVNFDWPYPNFKEPHKIWTIYSTAACFLVGWWGKVVLTFLNTTKFNNLGVLKKAMFHRPKNVPLITVANHESCLDDPCIIGALMTNKELMQQSKMRWGLAAHDICYRKPWHGWVMSRGKCAPIVRGLGVYQRSVDFVIDRLNEGDWLHIFPEGKVNMERKELHRLKWGIGRIIADMEVPPIVIPFWHVGMQNVLPNIKPYFTRAGKKVFINIGKPIDLTKVLKSIEGKKAVEKRKIITDIIQAEMEVLRLETLQLAKLEGITNISEYEDPVQGQIQNQRKDNGII